MRSQCSIFQEALSGRQVKSWPFIEYMLMITSCQGASVHGGSMVAWQCWLENADKSLSQFWMFPILIWTIQVLEQLHPLGLKEDWADKLASQDFIARNAYTTFEHYLQVGRLQDYKVSCFCVWVQPRCEKQSIFLNISVCPWFTEVMGQQCGHCFSLGMPHVCDTTGCVANAC